MKAGVGIPGPPLVLALGAWALICARTEPPFSGSIDLSFGVNGKVALPQGMSVAGLAVQVIGGEERIVAVGSTPSSKKTRGTSSEFGIGRGGCR